MRTLVNKTENKSKNNTPFFKVKGSNGYFGTQIPDEKFFQQKPIPDNNTSTVQMKLEEEPVQMQEKEEEEPVQKKVEDKKTLHMMSLKDEINKISNEKTSTTIPALVQKKMENSFGTNFSNITIHQNDNSVPKIGAIAFTQGNEVHFAPGHYNPNTSKGQELLGHELTHVVQQRHGKVSATQQAKGLLINDNPSLENEADVMGKKAANGESINYNISPLKTNNNNVLQGYFVEKQGSDNYRVSDDLSAAVREGYPNHILYAQSGKVATSNISLNSAGSGIELEENTKENNFTDGTKTQKLKQVLPKNKKNGTSGSTMKLWADCGKSAGVVVGSENRTAIYKDPASGSSVNTLATYPSLMRAEIMKKWLETELKSSLISKTDKANIISTLSSASVIKSQIDKLIIDYGKATTDSEKEDIAKKYYSTADNYAESMWVYYNSRSKTEKDTIDKQLNINKYINPEVGEGYTMSSGGNPIAGNSTWNYHWGGVIMKSNDSKDNVTLENYAVGDPSVQNELWDFAMYGTEKDGQTFHEQHRATNQHGDAPTSMRIKKN